MNSECTPLRGARMEVAVFDVQVTRGDGLRSQSIEESNFSSTSYAEISIFQRLFLFRWFRNHFDSLRVEEPYVMPVAVKHLHTQHEVLSLVRVGNK